MNAGLKKKNKKTLIEKNDLTVSHTTECVKGQNDILQFRQKSHALKKQNRRNQFKYSVFNRF